MNIIIENIGNNHISALLIALFYTTDSAIHTEHENLQSIYLQEFIKINFINKIQSGKSLIISDLQRLETLFKHYGYSGNTITDLFDFLMPQIVSETSTYKYTINTTTTSFNYLYINDITEPTIKSLMLNKYKNIYINKPNIFCIAINRENHTPININKKISTNVNNNLLQRTVWDFQALICLRNNNYYTLFTHNKKYYIFDAHIIPSIIQINIKDKYVMDIITREVCFVIYKY